jgi:hypothetical protein
MGGGSATGGGSAGGSAVGGGSGGGSSGGGSVGGGSGGGSGGAGCAHPLAAADRLRKIVVSHPFAPDGGDRDNLFEVLNLSANGTVAITGQQFRMGVAASASAIITFTPDGTIGLVPQDDGTLGVFHFFDAGTPEVITPAFNADGGFYATAVLMAPDGRTAWVLDSNTRNNGGGIYHVAIGCDGTPAFLGQSLPGDNPWAAAWLNTAPLQALVYARSLGDSPDAGNLHVIDFSTDPPTRVASIIAFPDQDAVPSSVAVRLDDHWVALPDTSFVAGNRVELMPKLSNIPTPRPPLDAMNPFGVSFSPFDDEALLITSNGTDHYKMLFLDGGVGSDIAYAHGAPQLPGPPVMITRGMLLGRLFIAELDSVRQLGWNPDGGIDDVSKTTIPMNNGGEIIGTLGVAP